MKKNNETPKTKKMSIMDMFSEVTRKWEIEGESMMLSKKECALVTECKVKCYAGEHGDFSKLYLSIEVKGKTLTIKDGEHTGIKLDAHSEKHLGLEAGEEEEIAPEDVIIYRLKNTSTGEIITRARVVK